jgi:tRNA A37 threonylcarbamoyladenosine biosynthesis protein TsaE
MDLYRLSDRPEEQDLLPLNLDYVFENCVSLIEWPSRIGADRIPSERLDVQINIMQLPVTDDESDGNDEQNNESSEDRPRLMLLKPRGTDWENILRELRDEGYLDDLLG